ncbi:MAG: glucuronate isomerase [Ignavibacteria bacterium]|nr:MAG: glucuronate isomerase [Ignavibacteria bacterium]
MKEYNSIFHEDRFFDPNPEVRKIAWKLYNQIKNLPIISPHGHVDPKMLALNEPFPNPTELFLIPDHYIFRMLYSQGISLEELGIPTINEPVKKYDERKVWKIFAEHFYLFLGTPTGIWLTNELYEIFGITERLNGENADEIYDAIQLKLSEKDFLPRSLFNKFNIEILSTTDSACDELEYHKIINETELKGRVIPTFRPDSLLKITSEEWADEIKTLSRLTNITIDSFPKFIQAIEERRKYFKSMGCVATDHGVRSPYTHELTTTEVENIFQKSLKNEASEDDEFLFTAHMLMEFARMSCEDELVMQLHPGAHRDHNQLIFNKFGKDKGGDIPERTEYTNNLKELLNKYGNNKKFKLIVFTLDESTYSRELAPLAGHYPALKIGPPWWFHDSLEGMKRYREHIIETAGFFNTVGFNDDTRAFLSIPARHDVARRMDSNYLAGLVARHIITMNEAEYIAHELTYGLVKREYNL